jgi:hypothetical protein
MAEIPCLVEILQEVVIRALFVTPLGLEIPDKLLALADEVIE